MVGCQQIVGNIGAAVDVGIHAERRRVDDHGVALHDFGGDLFVGDAEFLLFA